MEIIPHNSDMVTAAITKAEKLGPIRNSILKGGGNRAGYLGEEALSAHIGATIVSSDEGVDKYDHDLLLNGKRIEVKTKRRTVPPKEDYDVSVAKTSTHQKPDLYMFVSLEFGKTSGKGKNKTYSDLQNVWLLGQKTPEEYFNEATLWESGDIDSSNGFTTHVDMYNLPIDKLDRVGGKHGKS